VGESLRVVLKHEVVSGFFFFQAEDGIRARNVTGSSHVCSSDLLRQDGVPVYGDIDEAALALGRRADRIADPPLGVPPLPPATHRSEERRVGKECRSRGPADHEKKRKEAEPRRLRTTTNGTDSRH